MPTAITPTAITPTAITPTAITPAAIYQGWFPSPMVTNMIQREIERMGADVQRSINDQQDQLQPDVSQIDRTTQERTWAKYSRGDLFEREVVPELGKRYLLTLVHWKEIVQTWLGPDNIRLGDPVIRHLLTKHLAWTFINRWVQNFGDPVPTLEKKADLWSRICFIQQEFHWHLNLFYFPPTDYDLNVWGGYQSRNLEEEPDRYREFNYIGNHPNDPNNGHNNPLNDVYNNGHQ
ncbi:MAG: hypothetical protein Q9220_001833 [cf. Caloplaca sp. 1 TL-2023]